MLFWWIRKYIPQGAKGGHKEIIQFPKFHWHGFTPNPFLAVSQFVRVATEVNEKC